MADRVDAAIAALSVVLKEAEKSVDRWWKARRANCWIDQLPGSSWGRWRHLRLRGDITGDVGRRLFISDLRAVLAYLEAHRDEIKIARAWPWSYSGRARSDHKKAQPVDVEFREVKNSKGKASSARQDSVRFIKG
jgi:hypothetical protein